MVTRDMERGGWKAKALGIVRRGYTNPVDAQKWVDHMLGTKKPKVESDMEEKIRVLKGLLGAV